MTDPTITVESPEDFGNNPQGEVRRWLMELSLSDKREKDFRELGKKIWDKYRGKGRKKNSFNILWSNTETLAPAVFNSPPQPNVRRRFKDADPVGKLVSTVLERCLEFQTDNEQFMSAISMDVLDTLLPGRGTSRIRYVPSVVQTGEEVEGDESQEGVTEELAWEQVTLEHVQWDDFRHGPGKTWPEVQWCGFRHRMTRDELVDKFGEEIGKSIALDEPADDDLRKNEDMCGVFQTAEVWEMWCLADKKVRFISQAYRKSCLKVVDDPLKLTNFYPNPKPLYAIQDSASLDPLPLYEQYKEQAEELNRISTRINKIIDAMKVRGLYDATMAELSELLRGDDNDLVPVQNAAMWAEKGGIEKAIWMMPMADAAKTLQVLYQQREATKQVIYEVTGISDVMRGATDPNETLGAQQLKAQSGGRRIQNMQREVQRYARDIIRLMAEVCAEKFQPETLLKMTGLQIPTEQEVAEKMQQMQFQYQQAAQQAQMQGQQPPPPPQVPPKPITLEQVMAVLRDDAMRTFKVDVETDSMVAATMQDDMQGLQQVLQGITGFIQGVGPAVQAGAVPIEAVKEIVMSISRRAKLGSVVEDALDKMKAPEPQADPNAAKAQAQAKEQEAKQAALQQQQQHDQQTAQRQQAHEEQIAQRQQQHAEQLAAAEQGREQERQMFEQRMLEQKTILEQEASRRDEQAKMQQALLDDQFKRWEALLKARTTIETAEINSEAKAQIARESSNEGPQE